MSTSRMLRWLWLSALVIGLDQASKLGMQDWLLAQPAGRVPVLPGLFEWVLAYNRGAAFSFLGDADGWQRWLFLALAGVVSVVLTLWLARLEAHERRLAAALALVIGGAVGNLIDRVFHGHVIDFIQVYIGTWPFPVFNLADSAISLGAALLVLDSLLAGSSRHSATPER